MKKERFTKDYFKFMLVFIILGLLVTLYVAKNPIIKTGGLMEIWGYIWIISIILSVIAIVKFKDKKKDLLPVPITLLAFIVLGVIINIILIANQTISLDQMILGSTIKYPGWIPAFDAFGYSILLILNVRSLQSIKN